jgi:hypothetical protein
VAAICLDGSYGARPCQQLGDAIRASLRGNMGRRPGALCRALGACAAGAPCNATAKSSATGTSITAGIDACTLEGVVGGAPAGGNASDALAAGQCMKDSDCGAKQQCERLPGAPVRCACEGGGDKCTPVGTCADFCAAADVKQVVAAINGKVGGWVGGWAKPLLCVCGGRTERGPRRLLSAGPAPLAIAPGCRR